MAKLFFPKGTLSKMAGVGLGETDIYDIFDHGEHGTTSTGTLIATKKYSDLGYELGIFYTPKTFNDCDYTILTVWKKERR